MSAAPLATETQPRPRVLSGMRPTGKLHLGNYMGALFNWVRLQDQYDCFFFIADWHALTTDYADPSRLLNNIFEITVDFLSAGLDPAKCTLFVQSHVPQHAELNLLFGMFTPLGLLERVPTYKDQQEQLKEKDLATYGFLGYPLLQSADILLYTPEFVPVGQDQVAHVELTREVARKFNHLYSPRRVEMDAAGFPREVPDEARAILPEPAVLLTPSPKLPGLDGRKMSKSYGNSILLSDPAAAVDEKMQRMSNGGQRNPQTLPGEPDICPVGDMHALFSDPAINERIRNGCRTATIGCPECKGLAAAGINAHLEPIRARRAKLEEDPAQVWRILDEGAVRAGERAALTMEAVRAVTGLSRTARPLPPRGRTTGGQHDLSAKGGWWALDPALAERSLREHWLTEIVPGEAHLQLDPEGVYVTRRKKRVLLSAAREDETRWTFTAKPKTYEVLALLCWDATLLLHDFIVPQSVYVAAWTAIKKREKKAFDFFVERAEDGRFLLHLPGAEPIDISALRGQYQPLL